MYENFIYFYKNINFITKNNKITLQFKKVEP